VHVESVAHDLYAAIDCLMDRLDRQVMKYKNKIQDHNHQAIKHLPENEIPAAA
jgi:putative sigma-54 modulation protein